jgi:hypothetical protein
MNSHTTYKKFIQFPDTNFDAISAEDAHNSHFLYFRDLWCQKN